MNVNFTRVNGEYKLNNDTHVKLRHTFPSYEGEHGAIYELDGSTYFLARAGWIWDGDDVVADVRSCIEASMFHDWLYGKISKGHIPKSYRKASDKEYVHLLRNNGMSHLRSGIRGMGLAIGRVFRNIFS